MFIGLNGAVIMKYELMDLGLENAVIKVIGVGGGGGREVGSQLDDPHRFAVGRPEDRIIPREIPEAGHTGQAGPPDGSSAVVVVPVDVTLAVVQGFRE